MRLLAFIAILMLSIVSVTAALAQEGTPVPPGATVEVLADPDATAVDGPSATPHAQPTLAASPAADQPERLVLYRIEVPLGGSVESHEHYDGMIWYVEQGTLTYSIQSGESWARCSGGCLPEGEQTTFEGEVGAERLPLDTEITLEPGDWVMQNDTTTHTYTNTGDSEVVILATGLYDPDEVPAAECGGGCM